MFRYLRARRWHSVSALRSGPRCRPYTTRGMDSHAGLSPGASSTPEGKVSNQLKCTLRSSTGGCGLPRDLPCIGGSLSFMGSAVL